MHPSVRLRLLRPSSGLRPRSCCAAQSPSSEATLQLSGIGQYLTILGYGVNAAAFDANPAQYGAISFANGAYQVALTVRNKQHRLVNIHTARSPSHLGSFPTSHETKNLRQP